MLVAIIHYSVNHSISEYVRGFAHTNTIEGVFSHFKRSIIGTFFHISPKHTQRYCDEFAGKYNTRKMKDAERFVMAIKGSECRLRYKQLVAPVEDELPVVMVNEKPLNRNKGILQLKDGEIVGHYTSLGAACRATGIDRGLLSKVCNGKDGKLSAGGFNWIYA